jgi:spore germination cell wall hydrolase CwlJ-like protein
MKKLIFILFLLPTIVSAHDCDETETLALAMYHEARGEGIIGMQMVGEVILNRVNSIHFPDTICSVINAPGQFTFPRLEPREQDQWKIAKSLAARLIDGDFRSINPAALYFNPGINSLTFLRRYGNHSFYM